MFELAPGSYRPWEDRSAGKLVPYEPDLPDARDIICLIHVCSSWRQIVIGMATLWGSSIYCVDSRPELLEMQLERSQQAPLNLYILQEPLQILHAVLSPMESPRIQRLVWNNTPIRNASVFTFPAPKLRHVCFRDEQDVPPNWKSCELFCGHTPLLTSAAFINILHLPLNHFLSLSRLLDSIRGSILDTLTLILRCPNVDELVICSPKWEDVVEEQMSGLSLPPARLNKLCRIRLYNMAPLETAIVLNFIQLPASSAMELSFCENAWYDHQCIRTAFAQLPAVQLAICVALWIIDDAVWFYTLTESGGIAAQCSFSNSDCTISAHLAEIFAHAAVADLWLIVSPIDPGELREYLSAFPTLGSLVVSSFDAHSTCALIADEQKNAHSQADVPYAELTLHVLSSTNGYLDNLPLLRSLEEDMSNLLLNKICFFYPPHCIHQLHPEATKISLRLNLEIEFVSTKDCPWLTIPEICRGYDTFGYGLYWFEPPLGAWWKWWNNSTG